MVSIAYMDPGNYATDIESGAHFGYKLVWSVWLASAMAMLFQYLSGKLGVVTGKSLAELISSSLRRRSLIVAYWLSAEASVAATDLAEFLGTTIALNLVLGIPLVPAALISSFSVFIILPLLERRFRVIEGLFAVAVGMIGLGFFTEIFVTRTDLYGVALGSIPTPPSSDEALYITGIVGATVMPHAIYVHSYLAKNKLDKGYRGGRDIVPKLHTVENIAMLFMAGLINVMILGVSAAALYPSVDTSLDYVYGRLVVSYGIAAALVFVVTLFASGIASSMLGVIAGQAVMEGFLGRGVNVWLRRIVTRLINVFITLIMLTLGFSVIDILFYSQVLLSLMLPTALVPLIYYTSSGKHMGNHKNNQLIIAASAISAAIIVLFNVYSFIPS